MVETRTDQELLVASQIDPDAFLIVYDRWAAKLLAYFYRRTFDLEDSADLVAETFAVAYQRRGKFRDEGKPGAAWIFGIARNELSHYWRKREVDRRALRKLGIQVPSLTGESIERIEELADAAEYKGQLADALRQLSLSEREAVRLRVIEEMDYRTISAGLGCSEAAARKRVQRGLSKLATILEGPQ